jgi:hypothetical protein
MDRTDDDGFNIQYQRHLDEDRLENDTAMRMRQLEHLLVVERVYLGVADVGDAKNPVSECESAPRCTRRDSREHIHTQMVWGWESIGESTRIHVYDNVGQKLYSNSPLIPQNPRRNR